MKNKNLFRTRGSARWLITLIALLTLGVGQMLATNNKAIYYDNSSTKWAQPYCHHWTEGKSGGTTWPGDAMKQVGSSDIWVVLIDIEDHKSCIFNNNSGTQTDTQTTPTDSDNMCKKDGSTVTWSALPVFKTGDVLYLKPNSNWLQKEAGTGTSPRFAVYFYSDGDNWASMVETTTSGYYSVTVPSGTYGEYPYAIFCRMTSASADNNWGNKWNQSADRTPVSGKNLFVKSNDGWDGHNNDAWNFAPTITLTQTGATSAGTASMIAFPGASATTVPTMPSKTNYSVDGYFTAVIGGGNKVINSDGTWVSTISGYTSSGNWSATSNQTLYAAYYQTVALDDNGGSSDGSAKVYLNGTSMSITTAPQRTGYHVDSYHVNAGCTTLVASSAGVLEQATTTFTNSDGQWTYTASSTPTLYTKWTANTYTIHFNGNDNTDGEMSDQTGIAYDAATTITANAFTRTGYTFQGWATSKSRADNGDVDRTDEQAHCNLSSTDGATVDLYAVWAPRDYTITLTQSGETGYDSNHAGTESVSATFDATMPTITTVPTALTGYKFQGYFTGHNGTGTQFTDGEGTWVSAVTDTISAGNWVLANTLTLYAYFKKAEISTLELSASIVHKWESTGTKDSITVEPTLSLTPEGTVLLCYEVQYSDGADVTDDGLQSFRDLGSNSVRFRAPSVLGSFRLKAELKTNNCSGTVLDTKYAYFSVARDYSVTVRYICDGKAIRDPRILSINALDSTSVTAPTDIFGYTFSEWEASSGITSNTGASVNPKKFVASYDGTITAKYIETPTVYFYNNLGWSDVWVTYDSYFDGTIKDASDAGRGDDGGTGSGNYGKTYNHMKNIAGTDIWYDEVPSYYTANGFEHWAWNITFNNTQLGTEGYPSTYKHFNSGEAVIRYDFDPQATMFVPTTGAATFNQNGVTYKSSTSTYHNDEKLQIHNCGYWKKYNSTSSGYSLRGTFGGIVGDESNWDGSNHNLVADSKTANEFTTALKLYGNRDYYFRIFRNNRSLKLDKASGFTQKDLVINQNSNRVNNTFRTDVSWVSSADVTLHTSTEGVYTFYVNFKNDGTMLVTVDYPDDPGDYQVMYKDAKHTAWHPAGNIDSEASTAINSFFVRKNKTPQMQWRKITGVTNAGVVTWNTPASIDLSSYTGSGGILENKVDDTTGVYNFKFNIAEGALSLSDVEAYTGDYYIRTNSASAWKWENYTDDAHKMTYSEYADLNSGFSHYFMKYVGAGSNVKFVVANQYSPCISDTLGQGTQSGYVDASDNLIANSNIRYSWNMHDNSLDRAYVGMVDRSTPRSATHFLVLQGQDGYLLDSAGNALNSANQGSMYVGDYAIEFDDNEDWVYETTIKAKANGKIKIYSQVNSNNFYLVGGSPLTGEGAWESSNSDELITGTGESAEKIRVIYDFKTGRLISAWLPSSTVSSSYTIKADVMIVRAHQEAADQINMSGGGRIQLTTGKTVYSVMRFNKYVLNNRSTTGGHDVLPVGDQLTLNERANYYVSFPYDVKVSDIFGIGSYGPDWTLRYYDGKGRAKNGFWADSPSFWKYVPPFGTLKANEGYLLSLNMNNFGTDAAVWNNGVENIELYFPASGTIDIQQVATFDIDSLKVAEYECKINRGDGTDGDRRKADSYWRCIGVPSFTSKVQSNTGGSSAITWQTSGDDLPFLYDVNWAENGLTAVTATNFTFKPMHAYMVQNGNLIRWTSLVKPVVAAAPSRDANPEQTFRLAISKDEVFQDQAFVRLTDKETVTTEFDFGQDLSKEFNPGANIYTYIGYERVAANSLPLVESTTVIPVGVQVAEAGEYTIAMPDGTNGVGVTLIDNVLDTRTNLGLIDYTVTLSEGATNDRFLLEISPIKQIPTEIDYVQGDNVQAKVRKVMIDGVLYIVKDGQIFDARGARVK